MGKDWTKAFELGTVHIKESHHLDVLQREGLKVPGQ